VVRVPGCVLRLELAASEGAFEGLLQGREIEFRSIVATDPDTQRAGLHLGRDRQGRPSQGTDIRVAGAVDQRPRAEFAEASLGTERQPPGGALGRRGCRHRVQPQLAAGLPHRLVTEAGIEGRFQPHLVFPVAPRGACGEVRQDPAGLLDATSHQLPADTRDDLSAPGVEDARVGHSGHGDRAAEDTVLLDQQRSGASACRLHGRHHAGGAAADHDHIVAVWNCHGVTSALRVLPAAANHSAAAPPEPAWCGPPPGLTRAPRRTTLPVLCGSSLRHAKRGAFLERPRPQGRMPIGAHRSRFARHKSCARPQHPKAPQGAVAQ